MKKKVDDTDLLIGGAIEGIFEKNGNEVVKIDLRNLEYRVADHFIICHGKSTTQVDSICDSVEDMVRQKLKIKPYHVEGLENCFWVLLDYGNVLVHIFLEEYRGFYNLESLWADADIKKVDDVKVIQ